MVQKSKKNHIVEIAYPLFLENGFKGTSIDLVVKVSGVSKPTVYNHFPDKSALMQAVVEQWIADHQPGLSKIADDKALAKAIDTQWLEKDTVRLYAIVIGEGFRFPEAKKLFWLLFDSPWRQAFISASSGRLEQAQVELLLDRQLLYKLKQL